jgi:hypothetical protein
MKEQTMKSMNLLAVLAVGAGLLSVPALALENAVKTQLTAVKNAPAHTSADYNSILAGLPAQDFADALSYLLNDLNLPLAEVTAIANSAIGTMDAGKQVECVETVNDTVPSIIIDDSSLKDEAKTELAARAAARLAAAAAIFNTPAKVIIDNPRGISKP